MDFHGAEMPRTWVKLGATAAKGKTSVTLAEPVPGWRVGDRVILTATHYTRLRGESDIPSVRDRHETEERTIRAIDGPRLELDAPLERDHTATGAYRGEVALLSRNVVVESADPDGIRGHTMYHRHSAGSISYAEFRHLGKAGKLGKYSLHFHRVGDTMRGSSVIGASIWDSGNRWITIHGTNGLLVRDCVGYRSIGHGFFLEDGTEVDNILDGNLAVQACQGAPLPDQALAFDRNEGAGFWWANSRNAFMRNVAVECDQYGFRYEAPAMAGFDPKMTVRGADGSSRPVDIRTLPFVRFQDNEAHAQRSHGVNLGGGPGSGETGGVGGVGPDVRHPFAIRGLRVWYCHWAVTLDAPSVLIDGLDVAHCEFGLWRPRYDRHAYRNMQVLPHGLASLRRTRPAARPLGLPRPARAGGRPATLHGDLARRSGRRGSAPRPRRERGRRRRALRPRQRATRRPLAGDFSRWEAELDLRDAPGGLAPAAISAEAVDDAGNVEAVPHRIALVRTPSRMTGNR